MAAPRKIHIVGVGDDGVAGLTTHALEIVEGADVLIGAESALVARVNPRAERLSFGGDLESLVRCLAERGDREVVVLASGDPLFHGTARYLCDRLGKDRFEVVPHVSSMQLAFARVKESWEEAYLADLAKQPLAHAVEKIRTAEKAGMFTTEADPPARVASALLARGVDYFTAYVCENLGAPDERVTQGELAEIATLAFSPLNVLILVRKPNVPDRPAELRGQRLFGNPDDVFLHSKPTRGLLTPAEVRVIALAEMDLGPRSVVWDVGAGSGSVAIEAARLAAQGRVFAIEMDPEQYQLLARNIERFGLRHVAPVLGQAPAAWSGLPDPDAVFVGGAGRAVSQLVDLAFERLRPGGRMVTHVNSLENISATKGVLAARGGNPRVLMLNIARGDPQLESLRFEAMNPTFLLSAVKPG